MKLVETIFNLAQPLSLPLYFIPATVYKILTDSFSHHRFKENDIKRAFFMPFNLTDTRIVMSELFWNKAAERYAKQPVADQKGYEKKLRMTQQYLTPEMSVLEFGCGTGSTAIAHAPFVKNILAIDISENMISIAKTKLLASKINNITFKKCSIENLEVEDQSFDMIMAHSILHLVDNPDDVISKIYTKLKVDGVFVSSTVCMGDSFIYSMLARLVTLGSFFGIFPKLRILSSKKLLNSMVSAGFSIDYEWNPKNKISDFIIAKKIL